MKRPPPSLRCIVIETCVLVGLQIALTHLLARARLLEHLLAPGGGSRVALGVTVSFLLLRVGVIVLLPGWFLARIWLWATDCRGDGRRF